MQHVGRIGCCLADLGQERKYIKEKWFFIQLANANTTGSKKSYYFILLSSLLTVYFMQLFSNSMARSYCSILLSFFLTVYFVQLFLNSMARSYCSILLSFFIIQEYKNGPFFGCRYAHNPTFFVSPTHHATVLPKKAARPIESSLTA